jgi:hypothetical protein
MRAYMGVPNPRRMKRFSKFKREKANDDKSEPAAASKKKSYLNTVPG